MTNNGIEIAKLSSIFMKEIFDILKEHCDNDATEIDLFSCLIAVQTISETIISRLRNIGIEEELIQLAIENSKNQVLLSIKEDKGFFYMKGEEI